MTARSIGEGMNMRMKNFGSRIALAVLFSTPLLLAAQATTGKIHGTVSDPAGSPENGGTVLKYFPECSG